MMQATQNSSCCRWVVKKVSLTAGLTHSHCVIIVDRGPVRYAAAGYCCKRCPFADDCRISWVAHRCEHAPQ